MNMEDENWVDIVMDNIGDENIYSEQGREFLVDDEEITPMEAAFMQGYDEAFD